MSERRTFDVAVIGASGLVGQEMVKILGERDFPVRKLSLFASERSIGASVYFKDKPLPVDVLREHSLEGFDLCLFSAGNDISEFYVPLAAKHGALCVDNSSFFRMHGDVPLVVPEVNLNAIPQGQRIVANPNCSTIQLAMVLKPLHDAFGLKRVVVSTYQAVSGAGREATEELSNQVLSLYNSGKAKRDVFAHQIAFNLIPLISDVEQNGYSKEEMKLINESRKILSLPHLAITATAVRVPVFNGHSESVSIETEKPCPPEAVRGLLEGLAGVTVMDEPDANLYPMPLKATNQDDVFVGRIRKDYSVQNGVNLFIVADNLRKGAALNAVQIAECVLKTQ